MPARIGILGGTFDPIHIGHLVAAVNARDQLALDRVLLVVANEPWQKASLRTLTAAEDRYAVVAAAVAGIAGLEASRLELDRGGVSYTLDTVLELRRRAADADLFLIVGADIVPELSTWQRVGELSSVVRLVVVDRGGVPPAADPAGWKVDHLEIPRLELSSSDLRGRLADGRPVDYLIPEAAMTCIAARNLYAAGR